MHRFEDFIVRRVLPDYVSLKERQVGDSWGAMLRCRLVEHMLWLHLGVEVGVFPAEPAEEFYTSFFQIFFRSLLSQDPQRLEEMKKGQLYVAHSEESNSLILTFPRFARILIERAMRKEDIFSIERLEFSNSGVLRSSVQTLIMLTSQAVHLRPLAEFVHGVNFVEQAKWDADWNDEFPVADIIESQQGSKTIAPQICAGFLQLWGHASKLTECFGRFKEHRDFSREDIFKLQQRTREIQSWMLNLSSRQTSSRFEQVRSAVTRGIDSERIPYRAKQIAQESMDSVFESWFAATPELETVDA